MVSDAPERQPLPYLYIFFGLSGSGKSYLGRRWAEQVGAAYYNSDRVRKELAGLAGASRQRLDFNCGIYSPEFSRKTYDRLIVLAKGELAAAKPCVLDATYTSAYERDLAVKELAELARIIFIMCKCSDQLAQQRFTLRASDPKAVSDGRWEIYQEQKRRFTQPDKIKGAKLLVLDTDAEINLLLNKIASLIRV